MTTAATAMTPSEASLPIALSRSDRVAIIAGSGSLPLEVAQALNAGGHAPFVVAIAGEANRDADFAAYAGQTLNPEDVGLLVPLLRREAITHVVMAGGVSVRPKWRKLLNIRMLPLLGVVSAALRRGDNGLLSIAVRYLEGKGFKVVGAHQVVPDLLAPEGTITRARPNDADRRDLEAALVAARAIGALDIGQAAIAVGGRAVALEGIEGTDGLLERMVGLRTHGRIAGQGRGVIVKCAKPRQELRADLPTIGPATVEAAHAARLAGIGVEAGRSLILDQAKVIERADALGLFVVGLAPEDARERR
jgi:DUF1009 family protein